MAAINYLSMYGDPATVPAPLVKSSKKGGRVRSMLDTLTVPKESLDAGAVIFIARVPANAVLKTSSAVHHEAITSAADWDVGDENAPTGLLDAADLSSAGITALLSDVAPADLGKELWELLGYTANPGGTIDLYATCNTASTHTGNKSISFEIDYVVD